MHENVSKISFVPSLNGRIMSDFYVSLNFTKCFKLMYVNETLNMH